MSAPGIDELRAIVPPPPDPPPAVDWSRAERELGVRLPRDYVELAETWGAGSFDDFVSVFAPGHPNRYLDLLWQADTALWALRELAKGGETIPYEPRVVHGGLLPWAQTDNGDTLYWHLTDLEQPDSWVVVGNEARGPDWYRYEGGAAAFLADVLAGRETVYLFPDDIPSDRPGFKRA